MFVEFVDKLMIRLHQAMEGKQKCRVVRQQPKSLFSTGLQKTKEEVIADRHVANSAVQFCWFVKLIERFNGFDLD